MLDTTKAHAPFRGVSWQSYCLRWPSNYLLVFWGNINKLSGPLFLYEPLFVGAKILLFSETPKYLRTFLLAHSYFFFKGFNISIICTCLYTCSTFLCDTTRMSSYLMLPAMEKAASVINMILQSFIVFIFMYDYLPNNRLIWCLLAYQDLLRSVYL